MTEVLDQTEVDALLSAVSEGDVEQADDEGFVVFSNRKRGDEPVNIRTYDFKRPERVSKDQMQAMLTGSGEIPQLSDTQRGQLRVI